MTMMMKIRAINIRFVDLGYPAGTEDALSSFETSPAILDACLQLGGDDILDHSSAAYALWQDDPDQQVTAYLLAHYSAEDGDVLRWGAGSLYSDSGEWI
jgi:hypothetical protein